MKNKILPAILFICIFTAASCGFLQDPAPQPQLSATDFPPKATPLSELPPTWTPEPTPTAIPPSPTSLPTQDPENYRIDLALTPIAEPFPADVGDRSGWKEMEGKTASIKIPPEYEILDFAGTFMELMFGLVEAFAAGFSDLALEMGGELGVTPEAELSTPDLGEMPEFDFLIAVDDANTSAILLVSVDITPGTTPEDLINEALSDQENEFLPQSWISYTDTPYPVDRVIVDLDDPEFGPGNQAVYVIVGDAKGWNLVFTAPAGIFEDHLPLIESSIHSLTIK